ncbi:TonB-dependent receptor domain-containing protein [Sphingobium sp.]|uniref:TonB-dependent receptor n=1 Tax=Sphingobium sp. TaxID=1912891 RepID=UPI0028BD8015|nr:TonB-dependent receptor [Sphingobium sp.]
MARKTDWLLATGLTVIAMGTSSVSAQEAASQPAHASAQQSQEIVVTARRREERLQDVPVAATVVGQEQIRQYDLTSVANIKIAAPEISLDRGFTGSASSISLRGVNSSSIDGGVEQSVLLDFDGMAISRGRILNDALFDVEGLSVLKGPQAVFFGKNSPGGVVSIKSANPGSKFEAYVRTGYEFTSDNAQVEAAAGGPIGAGFGLRVAMFASDSQGYIHNQDRDGVADLVRTAASGSTFVPAAPSRLGAERKLAGRVTLTYDSGDGFTANFKMLASRYRGQGIQSFSEIMGCPGGRTRPVTGGGVVDQTGDCQLNDRSSQGWLSPTILANWSQVTQNGNGRPYSKNNSYLPTLTLQYAADAVTITSVTGYYDYDYASQGNADATAYSYFWSYSNERNKSFYQELRATTSFDGPLNFAGGGHYERNRRVLFVGAASGPLPLDPATGRYNANDNEQRNRSEAWSIFGQASFDITPELELAGGARYTRQHNEVNSGNVYRHPLVTSQLPVGVRIIGEKSQDNISPEATLTWRPSRQLTLYGAYKTGFLAGGFSNPGALSAITTRDTLSFDAETVTGFEIGAKTSTMNGRLTANLTGYRYVYKGLPLTSILAVNASTLTYVTQNAANTIAQGVEFEGAYRAPGGLTLRATAAYNDAHYKDFANAQCYTGQTAAQGCVPVGNVTAQDLSGRGVYRAPKFIATAGAVQTFDLASNISTTLNADVRYSSGYYTGLNLNPVSYQDGFLMLNAGARFDVNDRYSLAIIGRNLTNRRYGTIGFDKPGGSGEVYTVAGEPRSIVLQFETKF